MTSKYERHVLTQLPRQITVLNRLSTDVHLEDLPYGRCNVLVSTSSFSILPSSLHRTRTRAKVSEILGTLLLGENALE